jgi:hypothetical protein
MQQAQHRAAKRNGQLVYLRLPRDLGRVDFA